MNQYSLNQVYADPQVARCLESHPQDEHRARVLRALAPSEPIHAFWWGEVGGLVLATDRRLLQFPKLIQRRLLIGYNVRFTTWEHPYAVVSRLEFVPGGFFELPRVLAHKSDGPPVAILLGKVDPAARAAFVRTIEALLEVWEARPEAEREALRAATPPVDADREGGGAPSGLAAELQALYDLHRSGGLTDEEYQQAKSRLLER